MMKGFVVFALLVVSLDWGIGWTFGRLFRQTFTGERGGLTNYALTKDADLLVLGSSRAQYQVMPAVLRERLGRTAFNAGLKGHDFLYSVLLFDLWRRAHPAPRAILLQVDIESLLERPHELEAAQIFSPYLDESALVRDVLYSVDSFKRFEYWSRAYRYNGKAFSIARNLFAHPDLQSDGFIPAHGALNPAIDAKLNALDQDETALEQAHRPFADRKVRYLRDLAAYASHNQSSIVLFHTPLYRLDPVAHRVWSDRLRAVIEDLPEVGFIDICEATHPQIFANSTLYSDANHLNAEGAVILSTMLADELETRLSAHVDAGGHGHGSALNAQRFN